MYFTEEKLTKRMNELADYRYRDIVPIPEFQVQVDEAGEPGARPPQSGSWQTMKTGDAWSGRDLYLWLKTEVEIPHYFPDHQVVGLFDFGVTGGGNNAGFESLAYVDGVPFQGVDMNHQELFLTEEKKSLTLHFRLWSGLEGGGVPQLQHHRLLRADLAWLDEPTDDLYYTARAILEVVHQLPDHRAIRIKLLQALEASFHLLDWSKPGTSAFYDSVQLARETLQTQLRGMPKDELVTVHAVGHTHIDVAWLWRLKHTREKTARSFASVLRLMEQYPEYTFLQTQPQLYAYIAHDYPELYARIKQRVREGRWEAGGAMWLEADCNLPSGESLVRQIIYGKRFFLEEFGVDCTYLWLPDVFGYSWALPQILAKSGITSFVTSKLSWNEYNRFPHDTFLWRGLDGTEMLTHFLTTPTPGRGYTYNGLMSAHDVQGTWEAYLDKDMNQDLLIAYGYGDGGGGPNRDMVEMRRRLDALPGVPHVPAGQAHSFLHQLEVRAKAWNGQPKVWDGELYLEYHRGTYTSQASNKRMNRKLELALRDTEWLNVMAQWEDTALPWPTESLQQAWTTLLRNQFHDIIPGSSIHEVYEDSQMEYEVAWHQMEHARSHAFHTILAVSSHHLTIFNSSPWTTKGIIPLPVPTDAGAWQWRDENGQKLISQFDREQWFVQIEHVPAMGRCTVMSERVPATLSAPTTPFEILPNGITTPYYKVEWNEQGQWVRLYDREANRDILWPGERGNVFQVFEDKPLEFDAWNVDVFYEEKCSEVTHIESIHMESVGPLFARIKMVWRHLDSVIEQNIVLYSTMRRIDFETTVEWHQSQQLLKVAFPVDIRATEATYDIQFGNVKRPTHMNTSWDLARFETVGHQWADLSERGYGVSLLNDCKYGYDIHGHHLRLTLLKSAINPDISADQGHHEFTYALHPHLGDWVEGATVQAAWNLNSPLYAVEGIPVKKAAQSLLALSHPNVMVDAVKRAEDGKDIVVRMHEFTGMRTNLTLTGEFAKSRWQECDLLEQALGEWQAGPSHHFVIRPYEIKTFRIEAPRSGSA